MTDILPATTCKGPASTHFLLGHKKALEHIANSVGKMPHAWMFCGQFGIGKATLCYHMARWLLAPDVFSIGQAHDPSHPIFKRIACLGHERLLVLDSIAQEDIHNLRDFLSIQWPTNQHSVIIIDSIDNISTVSQNKLLKTLEEPPPGTVFLLVNHGGNVLSTLRSRCRQIHTKGVEDKKSIQTLMTHIGLERSNISPFWFKGSIGRLLQIKQNKSLEAFIGLLGELPKYEPVRYKQIYSSLGAHIETVFDFLLYVLERACLLAGMDIDLNKLEEIHKLLHSRNKATQALLLEPLTDAIILLCKRHNISLDHINNS